MSRLVQLLTATGVVLLIAIFLLIQVDYLSWVWWAPWWTIVLGLPIVWASDWAIHSIRKTLPKLRRPEGAPAEGRFS